MNAVLAPCGTTASYRRHLRRREAPCQPCRAAHVADLARYRHRRNNGRPRQLRPCGSEAAYRRHLAHREVPCRACVAAHTAQNRVWRKAA